MRKLSHYCWLITGILLLSTAAYAQSKKLTGKVTDDKSIPLAGVTIKAIGGRVTVQTDNSGSYAIEVSENTTALEFTFSTLR